MDSVIQFRGTIYENGYGLIAQKVMRDKRLPKQSKLIYAYMCSFAGIDKDGKRSAFPSVSLQCEELGMSEDTYYKWRKYLIQYGYITIEKRKDEKGKFDRNLYFIETVPVEKKDESEPYPKNPGTVKPSTENSGDNNNSFNNNSFNSNNNINTDDDKRNFSLMNDEELNIIISYFREETKNELTERSFKSIVRKVIDKYKQGTVNSFRDYFVTALCNKMQELELRKFKVKQRADLDREQLKQLNLVLRRNRQLVEQGWRQYQEDKETGIQKVPFYNWLEE
ncbi:helix-turn-helix domain-containing protein [Caldifermentibacillus hisashii]|uniref:helix-turn-helix domain-containing protein n=1 Tax=Caldifermentibacillus hisashii TaxID=996558 RepID=UPI002E1E72AF|nr:helix-turn-helix domain-containing protein [Caldifermentibacillus hisashii]